MKVFGLPSSILRNLYGGVVQLRNQLYDREYLKAYDFEPRIVSVGNITVGGTGKTPMLHHLLDWCRSQEIKVGIVSRGYGGNYKSPSEVKLSTLNAERVYGDEPVLTKKKYPEFPFFVSGNRPLAVQKLLESYPVDLILADDAFQHRKLKRDIDIVMLDAERPVSEYELLPQGRLREPLSALSRAHYVVLSRWNLASEDSKSFLLKMIEENSGNQLKKIIFCSYEIVGFESLNSSASDELSENSSVFLASGIANPGSFKKLMDEKYNVVGHKVFPDHYSYTDVDFNFLSDEADALGAMALVITEKDAVKFVSAKPTHFRVFKALLKLNMSEEINSLYEDINGFIG